MAPKSVAPKSVAPKPLDFSGSSVIKKELQTFISYVAYELMVSKDTMNTMAQYVFMEKKYLGDGSQDLALCEQALLSTHQQLPPVCHPVLQPLVAPSFLTLSITPKSPA
jgi:hypothetical protein